MAVKDMALYMRERRKSRREQLIELKGSKCHECGKLDSLEFNHRDREDKLFTLSGKGLDGSWDKILIEVNKCDLLCTECHKQYTRKQHSAGEIVVWNSSKDRPYEHGTTRMYNEKKCRCLDCVYARKLNRAKLLGYSEKVHAPEDYRPRQRRK